MGPLVVGALMALGIYSSLHLPSGPEETVVLVPSADGHVGTVVVQRGETRRVLDQPYAASRAVGAREVEASQLPEAAVRAEFRAALAALPARPISFLLYFVTGTDELTDDSKAELARMLEEVGRRAAPDIVVTGHTDRVGAVEANDDLSLSRAERVKADLTRHGIAADRIRAAGRGEREPILQTGDGTDEPRNRRVEISVR
jgi:outer membrane protein OmpA-like peptidoglycan-associated protein